MINDTFKIIMVFLNKRQRAFISARSLIYFAGKDGDLCTKNL